jgi:hypothetical protein
MMKFITLFIAFTLSILAADALVCKVVNEDEILKIKCIYKTARKDYDRNISMAWTSPSTPQDDRFKTVLLPAQHGSAYDFRYFDGRADGSWTISATDDSTGQVTSIEFVKEDLGEATTMSAPCKDSTLENPTSSQ